jgi:poly(3-hydroxybutyrate) depolymerase
MSFPSNPNGCWDWWGYTDKNYGTQLGVQMQFIKNLYDALTGEATKK